MGDPTLHVHTQCLDLRRTNPETHPVETREWDPLRDAERDRDRDRDKGRDRTRSGWKGGEGIVVFGVSWWGGVRDRHKNPRPGWEGRSRVVPASVFPSRGRRWVPPGTRGR